MKVSLFLLSEGLFFASYSASSQPALFQIVHELCIERTHVKSANVLSAEVDHIGVGNATLLVRSEESVFFSPLKRVLPDKSVVVTVEAFHILV